MRKKFLRISVLIAIVSAYYSAASNPSSAMEYMNEEEVRQILIKGPCVNTRSNRGVVPPILYHTWENRPWDAPKTNVLGGFINVTPQTCKYCLAKRRWDEIQKTKEKK